MSDDIATLSEEARMRGTVPPAAQRKIRTRPEDFMSPRGKPAKRRPVTQPKPKPAPKQSDTDTREERMNTADKAAAEERNKIMSGLNTGRAAGRTRSSDTDFDPLAPDSETGAEPALTSYEEGE